MTREGREVPCWRSKLPRVQQQQEQRKKPLWAIRWSDWNAVDISCSEGVKGVTEREYFKIKRSS